MINKKIALPTRQKCGHTGSQPQTNAKLPMAKFCINRQPGWRAIIWAGVIAGALATLVQVLLWLIFTDDFPAILFRDARLTAALVLGGSVLPPPATFNAGIMLAATLVHFALSIAYAALLAPLTLRLGLTARLGGVSVFLAGAGFGVVLYMVNLYGFTAIFPWFAQARSWIALVAHGVFGVTVISGYRCLHIRNARSQPDEH